MRRREADDGGSLELLLDTICNMFGTIMFVALVAALLALASRNQAVDGGLAEVDAERQRQIAVLEQREAELEQELEKLPAPEDPGADGLEDEAARMLGEIARRASMVEEYRESIESLREDAGSVVDKIGPLRAEVERLRQAVEAAERLKNRRMRTPLAREVNLELFVIVIWEDRLYPVCDWSNRDPGPCDRLMQWNDRYVHASRCRTAGSCTGASINFMRAVPLRQGAGIPVRDVAQLRGEPEFQALLSYLDRKRDLIAFDVAVDSFGSVAVAKEAFVSAGFNYCLDISESPLPEHRDSWVQGMPSSF